MRSMTVLVLAAAFGSAAVAAAQSSQVAVTTCGQLVPPRTVGYLTGDLDCTGSTAIADVILEKKASLDLRGFTLSGGQSGVACLAPCADSPSEFCNTGSRCRVFGGGTISGSELYGVDSGARLVDVDGITISNAGSAAIFNAKKVNFTNATVTGNATVLFAVDAAKLDHATVTGNATGIGAAHISMVASTATGNGDFDLATNHQPHVRRGSVCGVSKPNWHVCADD